MAQIFVSGVAHFFVVVGGSKIHERMAHFFIDIYNGWLDSIDSYDTKDVNRYSIYGILDYLKNNSEQDSELCHIERLYKMCHGYAHGSSVHVKYPLLQYFEVSLMIYYVINPVFTNIHAELEIEMPDEDKTLSSILERDFKKLYEQYNICSTEKFELYYKFHQSTVL